MTATLKTAAKQAAHARQLPRLLIEEWLPAAAIGVECMREENSATAKPPTKYFHVWWARRPLCASRAAVLASLLPADFSRDVFERLLGFGHSSEELVRIRQLMDTGYRVEGGFNCDRAFKAKLLPKYVDVAHAAAEKLWGDRIIVIDPMAGGGSIPLESARLGFKTLATEYNPVACSMLEATVDYPFRFGPELATKASRWAKVWLERIEKRLAKFYPEHRFASVHAYIFARTVPDPEYQREADGATGRWYTPLVPDWHLFKPKGDGRRIAAVPKVEEEQGSWRIQVKEVGRGAGQIKEPPPPTYGDGKGISLFTKRPIPAEYIKAMAQQGKMKSALYAVALKTPQGLRFQPPEQGDLDALVAAEMELAKVRPGWVKNNVIPNEFYPEVSSDVRPRLYGMASWAGMFSPRQLLAAGVLVQEFRSLRDVVREAEGDEVGEAVMHLLAFVLDKFLNHNCYSNRWENTRGVVKGKMDRHDYAFKPAFAELAPCSAGTGLEWATENTLKAFRELGEFSRSSHSQGVAIDRASATCLPGIVDKSITAVVVDPPYDDNVQYSEMANFFYVWLKRTQGHRRPEWFSTSLCEHDQEAVVNAS